MQPVKSFQVNVAQGILEDLKTRLAKTRWPDEPENAGWSYGTNPGYLRELVTYWQESFDWRKQETLLNSLPQYKVEIDGVEIHFIHVKGKGEHAQPLLLTHEWPDSIYRFYKVADLLTETTKAGGMTFDLVIPSMPGHGFSGRVTKTSIETAGLWGKLMTDILGYTTFYAGGDFAVCAGLSALFPDRIKGVLLTDAGYPNGTENWAEYSAEEQSFGQQIQRWFFAEGAFNMIQSTKPQTLGYALNDSPAGLAAWIVEKFYSWSDTHGDMENSFSKDELLTNIMIYWVTATINTSIRRYAADTRAMYAQGYPAPFKPIEAPTAVAIFPADSNSPREWAARRTNLQYFNNMPRGGRFAALEVPELYVEFIQEAVTALSKQAVRA
jgi:pimeloyl-ACP methyl ester carboxylesterase